MSSDGSNPGFMEDPVKPGDACLTAVFGQNSLLVGSGDWGDMGYLSIAPRKQEQLPKDHVFGEDKNHAYKDARIDGPAILLVFSKPEEARDLGRILLRLADRMEKVAKERGNAK